MSKNYINIIILSFVVFILSSSYNLAFATPVGVKSTQIKQTNCFNFNKDLSVGSKGEDVVALQTFLIENGYDIPAITEDMAPKGYFGPATGRALKQYQDGFKINTETNMLGAITRSLLNYQCTRSKVSTESVNLKAPIYNPISSENSNSYSANLDTSIYRPISVFTNPVAEIYTQTSNITGSVSLVDASTDTTNGSFDTIGSGVFNKNPNDWHWRVSLNNSSPYEPMIKSVFIIHNLNGEGWSSNSDSSMLGKVLYALILYKNGYKVNNVVNQDLIIVNKGSNTFDLYGQPESSVFYGGKLIINYSDNTRTVLDIPASSITQSGNESPTVIPIKPVESIKPQVYNPVQYQSPSCTVYTNKSTYSVGETIYLSWYTTNATYATWPQSSSNIALSLSSDKLNTLGAQTMVAKVQGSYNISLQAFGTGGNTICGKTISIVGDNTYRPIQNPPLYNNEKDNNDSIIYPGQSVL